MTDGLMAERGVLTAPAERDAGLTDQEVALFGEVGGAGVGRGFDPAAVRQAVSQHLQRRRVPSARDTGSGRGP